MVVASAAMVVTSAAKRIYVVIVELVDIVMVEIIVVETVPDVVTLMIEVVLVNRIRVAMLHSAYSAESTLIWQVSVAEAIVGMILVWKSAAISKSIIDSMVPAPTVAAAESTVTEAA
jgi:hypothetical protein